MTKPVILTANGETAVQALPKIKSIHPFGSKILVDCLRADEILGTRLAGVEKSELDGAPQAYIVEIGPSLSDEAGLKVGQRVYWTGKGTPVEDPRQPSRIRALLEISNIIAVIKEHD